MGKTLDVHPHQISLEQVQGLLQFVVVSPYGSHDDGSPKECQTLKMPASSDELLGLVCSSGEVHPSGTRAMRSYASRLCKMHHQSRAGLSA